MIIVTGASRGLGKAITERLIDNGEKVLGLARSTQRMRAAERWYVIAWGQPTSVSEAGAAPGMRSHKNSPPAAFRRLRRRNAAGGEWSWRYGNLGLRIARGDEQSLPQAITCHCSAVVRLL